MKLLFLKLLRDIRNSLGQFLSILAVLAVGCYFFAGMLESNKLIGDSVEDFYTEQNFADATATFLFVSENAIPAADTQDGILAMEGRVSINSSMRNLQSGGKCDAVLSTLTPSINQPVITEGRMPVGTGECIVDYVYAQANDLHIGDTVQIFLPRITAISIPLREGADGVSLIDLIRPDFDFASLTQQLDMDSADILYTQEGDGYEAQTFTVSGFYHSPELIHKVNTQNIAASDTEFACVLVHADAVQLLTDSLTLSVQINREDSPFTPGGFYSVETDVSGTAFFNQVLVDTAEEDALSDEQLDGIFAHCTGDSLFATDSDGAGLPDFSEIFTENPVGMYLSQLSYLRADDPSESSFRNTYTQITDLVFIIPFIFFLVAAIITFISLSKTVENQRTQIGIMQAIGIRKRHVYGIYLFYGILAAMVGSLFGGILGILTLPMIYTWIFGVQFNMPAVTPSASWLYVFIGFGVAIVVAAIASYTSCHRTLKEIPAQALRPKPPKRTRRILLERWTWLWNRIGFGAKMILRNMFLHKMRMLLSSVGIIGCITLLIAGWGIKDRVDYITECYADSLGYDMQVTLNEELPIQEDSAALLTALDPNIRQVTFASTLSVTVSKDGQDSRHVQMIALPEGSEQIRLYGDERQTERIPLTSVSRDGRTLPPFILPRQLAQELDIQVGDTVRVSGTSLRNEKIDREVVVTGIANQYIMASIYTTYDMLDEMGIGRSASTAYLNLYDTEPEALERSQAALTETEDSPVHAAVTVAYMLDYIDSLLVILDTVVVIIVIGAATLAMTVIYNITSINIFERTREIATLMVLGYKKHETNRMILVENMVITTIGCLLGLPLGYGLFRWLVSIVNSMDISLPGNLTWPVVLLSFAMAFLFSLLATLSLNHRMQKIDMVEALKSAE